MPSDHNDAKMRSVSARVAVIIPCYSEGGLVADAVHSIDEHEPVEVVVVDNASPDAATRETLAVLEREGVHVERLDDNFGPAVARARGLLTTSAPYVCPLDGDDLMIAGNLARMADLLDADPAVAACVGDIEEFGDHELVRRVPHRLDPYRIVYTNEYPITALFRRSVIEAARAWEPLEGMRGYEDWRSWMALAERGERIVHLGAPGYRRRLHGRRLNHAARDRHRANYDRMRREHAALFSRVREHRRSSDLSLLNRALYPLLYGARAEVPLERHLKPWFDRLGVLTRVERGARGGRGARRHGA
jgi:glycosyltransferase involved in cell wall biosynthesis